MQELGVLGRGYGGVAAGFHIGDPGLGSQAHLCLLQAVLLDQT